MIHLLSWSNSLPPCQWDPQVPVFASSQMTCCFRFASSQCSTSWPCLSCSKCRLSANTCMTHSCHFTSRHQPREGMHSTSSELAPKFVNRPCWSFKTIWSFMWTVWTKEQALAPNSNGSHRQQIYTTSFLEVKGKTYRSTRIGLRPFICMISSSSWPEAAMRQGRGTKEIRDTAARLASLTLRLGWSRPYPRWCWHGRLMVWSRSSITSTAAEVCTKDTSSETAKGSIWKLENGKMIFQTWTRKSSRWQCWSWIKHGSTASEGPKEVCSRLTALRSKGWTRPRCKSGKCNRSNQTTWGVVSRESSRSIQAGQTRQLASQANADSSCLVACTTTIWTKHLYSTRTCKTCLKVTRQMFQKSKHLRQKTSFTTNKCSKSLICRHQSRNKLLSRSFSILRIWLSIQVERQFISWTSTGRIGCSRHLVKGTIIKTHITLRGTLMCRVMAKT